MDITQARLILGLDLNLKPDSDKLLDCFEEAVFKEVTFFVRRQFLPTLAAKCIKKLHNIDLAAKVLGLNCDLPELGQYQYVGADLKSQVDILTLLSDYHSQEAEIKSILVNTKVPKQAVLIYNQWVYLFESFAQKYIRIFQTLNVVSLVNQKDIRLSEAIEFNDLYKELKDLKFNNLACREYYRLQRLMNNNK